MKKQLTINYPNYSQDLIRATLELLQLYINRPSTEEEAKEFLYIATKMKSKTFKCGNAYLASKEIEKDKTNPLSIFMAKVDEAINKLNTIYRQEFGTDINLKL